MRSRGRDAHADRLPRSGHIPTERRAVGRTCCRRAGNDRPVRQRSICCVIASANRSDRNKAYSSESFGRCSAWTSRVVRTTPAASTAFTLSIGCPLRTNRIGRSSILQLRFNGDFRVEQPGHWAACFGAGRESGKLVGRHAGDGTPDPKIAVGMRNPWSVSTRCTVALADNDCAGVPLFSHSLANDMAKQPA